MTPCKKKTFLYILQLFRFLLVNHVKKTLPNFNSQLNIISGRSSSVVRKLYFGNKVLYIKVISALSI